MQRVFLFAVAFFIAEWLRGHILTGFPWNLPGYGWSASTAVLQSTSVLGVYGLSLLTLLFGASLALLVAPASAATRLLPAAMAILFVALWVGWRDAASCRDRCDRARRSLAHRAAEHAAAGEIRARESRAQLAPAHRPVLVARRSSSPRTSSGPRRRRPFLLERIPEVLADIAALTGDSRVLMTGQVRIAEENGSAQFVQLICDLRCSRDSCSARMTNSISCRSANMFPSARSCERSASRKSPPARAFRPVRDPRTMTVPGAPPVGPLICYEIIFPGEVTGELASGLARQSDRRFLVRSRHRADAASLDRPRARDRGRPADRARCEQRHIGGDRCAWSRAREPRAWGCATSSTPTSRLLSRRTPFVRYGNVILLTLLLMCVAAALWPQRSSKA